MDQKEKETSQDIILAKLEEKFSQLLDVVNEIKNNLKNQTVRISEIDREVITLKLDNDQRKKDIDKLNDKIEVNKRWLMGIIATIIGGVSLAVVKSVLGI